LCGEEAGLLIEWRKLVCGVMIVIAPVSLTAQTTDRTLRGLLHNDGGTWLNGSPAPATAAIFADSLVQTQAGYSARINADGSTALIGPETVMQFQGNELALDHGSLQLDTAREMKVLIGCVTVTPTSSDRTEFNVTDVDGKVKIVALKNDVKIHLHGAAVKSKQGPSSDAIVREGEQATRADRCAGPGSISHVPDAGPSFLDSPWAWGTGLAAIGALTCWALCRGSGSPPASPVSPWKP
jgi:hypothetical protein